jgi:hypothetical protein
MRYLRIVVFFVTALVFALPVHAAVLKLETDGTAANGSVKVSAFLDTENESINALEGEMSVTGDGARLLIPDDGNTILNAWIEKPFFLADGRLRFSGIVPGGYVGQNGLIFSVRVTPGTQGAVLNWQDVRVLKNDGNGTAAVVTFKPLAVSALPVPSTSQLQPAPDTRPPEEFTPLVGRDVNLFSGRPFVVFAAQDKDSGIDHYEVCEDDSPCVTATSPYALQARLGEANIEVKAYDRFGNVRVEAVAPRSPGVSSYSNLARFGILLLSAAMFALIAYFLWRTRKKSSS